MAAIGAEFKGRAKAPSFYSIDKSKPAPAKKETNWPLLIGGALAGAALLLFLRMKGSSGTTGTGSVLSVYPSTGGDQSQIQNMQGTISAMLQNPNTGSPASSPTPNSQTSVAPAPINSGGITGPVSGTIPVPTGLQSNAWGPATSLGAVLDAANIAGIRAGNEPAPALQQYSGMAQNEKYSGVVGSSSANGIQYTVFKNGQPVATEQGTGSIDTVALARKYGL